MKKTLAALAVSVLSACGSGGGTSFKNPDSVQFSYGTPAAPSASEADAADAGGLGAGAAAALGDAADDPAAQSLANLPDDMAAAVFDDPTGAAVQARALRARTAMTRRAAAYAAGDVASASAGFDDPTCVTISLNQIVYDHCAYTDDLDGAVITVNGTFGRQASAERSEVSWDVTATVSLTEPVEGGTFTMKAKNHLQGDVAVTLTDTDLLAIVGFSRSDASASVTAPRLNVSMAFTHNADLDLDYQPSIDCVVGGTLELKRIWAERPSGASSAQYPDLGVKFEWTGCQEVSVAWGTLP